MTGVVAILQMSAAPARPQNAVATAHSRQPGRGVRPIILFALPCGMQPVANGHVSPFAGLLQFPVGDNLLERPQTISKRCRPRLQNDR